MHGEIGVRSELNMGSTFWFDVLVSKASTAVQHPVQQPAAMAETILQRNCKDKRLLVVDDDPISRDLILAQLKSIWPKIDVASDGIEAVDAVRNRQYDLILMDLRMPRMDGLNATREIRRLANGAAVPILAMTANVYSEDMARCRDAGMNDFIPKAVSAAPPFEILLKWLDTGSKNAVHEMPPQLHE